MCGRRQRATFPRTGAIARQRFLLQFTKSECTQISCWQKSAKSKVHWEKFMKKALLVGINRYEKQPLLSGCSNDIDDVMSHLVSVGMSVDAVATLKDEKATKLAILQGLRDLINGAADGDHLYFHFSGHGARMPTADIDEPDSADEVLCPYEFDWTHETAIIDNEILGVLDSLPSGIQLTFVVDSCHSGDFSRGLPLPANTVR